MVAPAATAAVTAGKAALDAAKRYGPGAVRAAKDYLRSSGAMKTIDVLAKGTDAEQASVITALVKGGVDKGRLSNALRELTPAEWERYSALIESLRVREAAATDQHVVGRESSGDPVIDAGVRNKQIHRLCGALNVSSDTLGELLTFFKAGTHSDIEGYVRDYTMQGWRPR